GTALEVPRAVNPSFDVERVRAGRDGTLVQERTLSAPERAALTAGGVLEVVRRVVEPRQQTLEVLAWAAGAQNPSRTTLVVAPEPDRLAVVRLDLDASQQPARAVQTVLGGTN